MPVVVAHGHQHAARARVDGLRRDLRLHLQVELLEPLRPCPASSPALIRSETVKTVNSTTVKATP